MKDSTVTILDSAGKPLAMQDTSNFSASRKAREFERWNPPFYTADGDNAGELTTIQARALDLDRNNPIASGSINTMVDNVIGVGLRLSAKPDYKFLGRDKAWADEWRKNVEGLWRSFADVPEFDAARQLTFGQMTALMLRTAFIQGEGLALALWQPDRPGDIWSTTMQSVDPGRLGSAYLYDRRTGISDGITKNEWGEPVSYSIKKNLPRDYYDPTLGIGAPGEYEEVAARTSFGRRNVIHLYEKRRSGQSRGKSILSQVMAPFKMLDHYQRIELQTAVINSMIAAFIETPLSGTEIADLFGGGKEYVKAKEGWEVNLEGASVLPLYPGEKMNAFNPGRPNSAYGVFVENVVRTIAAGINMPYELVLKDFSKTNYSSARAALLEAFKFFNSKRQWVVEGWCIPVYDLFLEEAVNKGLVEAPDFYENRAAYLRSRWIGPGRGYVDPLKEVQAAEKRMEIGVSTQEDECAEQGKDWEEVQEQQLLEELNERKLRDELGLPPAAAMDGSQPAPTVDEVDEESEEDESEQNGGDDR